MKWETDLTKDIRSNTEHDYTEAGINHFLHIWPGIPNDPGVYNPYNGKECTECNKSALLEQFLKVRDNAKAILEIGIGRNGVDSFAHVFFSNKKDETKYVGIDIEDRSWLVDCGDNIYTIQGSSSNYEENVEIFKTMGIDKFDFIFIDGDHSVNQVLLDWEYSRLLNDGGIVGFHDTSHHTGPYLFVRNLNTDIWDVVVNACPEDYGIGFATKK
jgi:cephalosporin hydroxylase